MRVGGRFFLQLKWSHPPTCAQKEINSTDPQTVVMLKVGMEMSVESICGLCLIPSFSLIRYCCLLLLCLHRCFTFAHATLVLDTLDLSGTQVLNVGEELTREILPLNMGQRIYELHGLKALRWYEVKISYPATIPASFSIAIVKDNSTKVFNLGRRLLNTEKLIFKAENILTGISGHGRICAFVSVQPAGIVAKSHLKEQEFVIFNIVCDELIYGIPIHAWWVGFLVLFVIIISCCIPTLLPPELLPRKNNVEPMKRVS